MNINPNGRLAIYANINGQFFGQKIVEQINLLQAQNGTEEQIEFLKKVITFLFVALIIIAIILYFPFSGNVYYFIIFVLPFQVFLAHVTNMYGIHKKPKYRMLVTKVSLYPVAPSIAHEKAAITAVITSQILGISIESF